MSIEQAFEELSFDHQLQAMAELVNEALKHIGLRLPHLTTLVMARLLNNVGTEAQIRAAKREARNVRFLCPTTAKALAGWAISDDPLRFRFGTLLTWFLEFMCDSSDKSHGEAYAQHYDWVMEIIEERKGK